QYTGQVDAEGRKFSTNTESSGRFHSKWMNMMYPRLGFARHLLREDGLLFVSINDAEQSRLRSLCDEIFGEENFLATLIWMKGKEGGNDNLGFGQHHEYVICYAKDAKIGGAMLELDEKDESRHITKLPEVNRVVSGEEIYKDGEPFQLINLSKQKDYKVEIPLNDGSTITWDSYSPQKSINELIRISKIFVGKKGVPYVKSFMSDEKQGTKPSSLIESVHGTTKAGGISIRELFGNGKIFSYPKPPSLIQRLIKIAGTKGENDLVIDFFAGSGTTGHAVMAQNAVDGGSRRFVLVQLPEEVLEGTDAFEEGFRNLTEICRERIRRAALQIGEEFPKVLFNSGFRSFKLEGSNFAVWDANAIEGDETKLEQQLFAQVEHVLPGRTNQDILFELMLKSRYELTTPVEQVKVGKCEVWKVSGGKMVAVIDTGLTVEVIREIVSWEPISVVILDRCFGGDDSLKANARKIFEDSKVDLKTV
ncbi:MAG: site-specific DNA-methyltransferase, partial [Planctomycetota bacterium]